MRNPALVLLLAVPLLAAPLEGQLKSSRVGATVSSAARHTIEGIKTSITARSLRWHWAATALGALAASTLDEQLTSPEVRVKLMSNAQARVGDKWGDPIAAIIILPGVFLTDRLKGTDRPEAWNRLELAGTSLVTVVVATAAIKVLVGRTRPNGLSNRSFPSGHTSNSFAVAEVVRSLYGNRAGAPFYLLAINTAISRIHDNAHYPSDVVAGAGLGVGIVRGFALAKNRRSRVSVGLFPTSTGLSLQIAF